MTTEHTDNTPDWPDRITIIRYDDGGFSATTASPPQGAKFTQVYSRVSVAGAAPIVDEDARELALTIIDLARNINHKTLPLSEAQEMIARRIVDYSATAATAAPAEQPDDDLISRAAVIRLVDVCTCGSGPEFRSMGMRYHALTCQTHIATLIRTLPTAAASSQPARDAAEEIANRWFKGDIPERAKVQSTTRRMLLILAEDVLAKHFPATAAPVGPTLHYPFSARHDNCAECDKEYEPLPPEAVEAVGIGYYPDAATGADEGEQQ